MAMLAGETAMTEPTPQEIDELCRDWDLLQGRERLSAWLQREVQKLLRKHEGPTYWEAYGAVFHLNGFVTVNIGVPDVHPDESRLYAHRVTHNHPARWISFFDELEHSGLSVSRPSAGYEFSTTHDPNIMLTLYRHEKTDEIRCHG